MENSLLETTWQLLQLSLVSCHISMIHIARYAHRWEYGNLLRESCKVSSSYF